MRGGDKVVVLAAGSALSTSYGVLSLTKSAAWDFGMQSIY